VGVGDNRIGKNQSFHYVRHYEFFIGLALAIYDVANTICGSHDAIWVAATPSMMEARMQRHNLSEISVLHGRRIIFEI
jgi:hypothetical protein